jgi:hypothetical protein
MSNLFKNPKCDGAFCKSPNGEVRVLPNNGWNANLCRDCFDYEMICREDINGHLTAVHKKAIPKWESLEVYNGE